MELTRSEELKSKRVAMSVTLFAFIAMVLFLIFKNIVTSTSFVIPSQSEVAISFGDNDNNTNKGALSISKKENESSDKVATDPKSEMTVEKSDAQKLADNYNANRVNNTASQITNEETTLQGINDSHGNVFAEKISEDLNLGYSMKGRMIISPPKFTKDTKEEGKVVVDIIIDKAGNVIEANPNGRGTTTANSNLKLKAKQMAVETKFNANEKVAEQRGTMTIVFSFN